MRGATILKASDDKTRELNRHTLMAFSGEAGDTSMLSNRYSRRPITLPNFYLLPFSPVCRIHPGQYTALFYAEWFQSGTLGCCKLRSWGIGTQPEIEKAVYGQFATGRFGSSYKEAEFVLAGLSGGAGSIAVRCSWIRSVCSWWSLLWILIFFPPSGMYKNRDDAKMITCTLGTTACLYLISIIILISTLSKAWRSFECAQMSWSGGYRSISKG